MRGAGRPLPGAREKELEAVAGLGFKIEDKLEKNGLFAHRAPTASRRDGRAV